MYGPLGIQTPATYYRVTGADVNPDALTARMEAFRALHEECAYIRDQANAPSKCFRPEKVAKRNEYRARQKVLEDRLKGDARQMKAEHMFSSGMLNGVRAALANEIALARERARLASESGHTLDSKPHGVIFCARGRRTPSFV